MNEPTAEDTPATPLVRVVRGTPTDAELAALVTVLAARSAGGEAAPAEPPTGSGWAAYWRGVRTPLRPGPGAWAASSRP